MRDLIDLPDLLIYLTAEGLLTSDDNQKLKITPPDYTRSDVIRELAYLIERKGENRLVKFMSALRKSASQGDQPGHQELLQLLEEDLAHEPQPNPRDCVAEVILYSLCDRQFYSTVVYM